MAERTLSSTQRSLRSLPTAARSPRSPPSSCQSPRRFDLQFPQTCQIGFRTLGNDYFIKNDLILFSVLTLYLTESCCALFPMVTYNPVPTPKPTTPTNLSTFSFIHLGWKISSSPGEGWGG